MRLLQALAGAMITATFAVGTARANAMVFKCNATWDGPITQTITVDLVERWMKWGQTGNPYKIISLNERYITGLQDEGEKPGGELWVMDRLSGEYWRAGVSLGRTALTPEPTEAMSSNTYHGKCTESL
jgi:hypothetical protein